MRDIRYKWNEGPNSVGVSNEVSLPQFKVLGHRQRAMEISLTTGKRFERTRAPSDAHYRIFLYWRNQNDDGLICSPAFPAERSAINYIRFLTTAGVWAQGLPILLPNRYRYTCVLRAIFR